MKAILNTAPVPGNDKDEVSSNINFPVVGIGAAAGGLPAIVRFFENMPASSGMTFIVILVSPEPDNAADQLVQRATTMPVLTVSETTRIQKEHVYIIAANSQLLMNDGYLGIGEPEPPIAKRCAIDIFFRALANTHQERSVAIIMSGNGADGAAGIANIRQQGGVTIVQAPDDAEYDGMPQAAINTGFIDFILPAVAMPQKLVELWSNARKIQLPAVEDDQTVKAKVADPVSSEIAGKYLQQIVTDLCVHTGHDFRHYKRANVLRRIERRMQVRAVSTLPAYHELLEAEPTEYFTLLKDMLIGVPGFFRDREAFATLERDIIPEFFRDKDPDEQTRAWIPACATGEEAYSIAMLLLDQASLQPTPRSIQIFASDIDEHAIDIARKGCYPASIVADVTPVRLRQFFTKQNDHYLIRKSVRDHILFAPHNLLRDPPFSSINLISCRNLLYNLNRDVQAQVLELFHFALKPNGILFLGSSDSSDSVSELFVPVDRKNRIYRARPVPSSANASAPRTEKKIPHLPHAKRTGRLQLSFDQIHQLALMRCGPVSVLIDADLNIVHMSERATHFLRFNAGESSRNLLALVLPELRLELRTALYQARQNLASAGKHTVPISRSGQHFAVTIAVHLFSDENVAHKLMLVIFSEEPQLAQDIQAGKSANDLVLHQLEAGLQRNRELLQQTINHAEITAEEWRATNAELQAMNEELRSETEKLGAMNYELKGKVAEISKANEDLNNLIAATDIATILVDRALRIKYFTPRATDIFSITTSDIGRSLLDLTHELAYEELANDVARTLETLLPVERQVRCNDGRYHIVRLLPFRTAADNIDGAVLTFFDITRMREAEARARFGEQCMLLVAESTNDYAILTMDLDGTITNWNRGAERIFGFNEAEMVGQSGDLLFTPDDRARGAAEEERQRAFRTGRAEGERWHIRKDGTKFYCSGIMTLLTNGQSGELYGFAKIACDQTERVELESQREAALTEEQLGRWNAETSSALKDQFLAILSHELRHPLNLIHINVELLSRLQGVQESPLGRKATNVIRSSVQSQAKIIEDLLDISRLNTGKLTLVTSPVDLASLVLSIIEVLQADTEGNDIAICTIGTDEPMMIMADCVRIEQVILNLLSNALKFTPAGGTVTIKLSHDDLEARVDVIDTGQGILPEALAGIFDMFSQAGPATDRSKSGLGIGLALVRQIAELHNGRVKATSDGPGKGTCFSIWLPLATGAQQQAGDAQLTQQKIADLRILLVDDSEDMISAFKALLELEGAKVRVASTAREGLHIVSQQKIDLLISDISMPEMNGYEFIEKVRQLPDGKHLPAIALSGLSREQDIAQCYKAGFSAHFNKPISLDKLTTAIIKLMQTPHEDTARSTGH